MNEQPHIGDIVQLKPADDGAVRKGVVLRVRFDGNNEWEAAELLTDEQERWVAKTEIVAAVGRLKGISRIDQPSRRTHGWFVRVYDGKKARVSRLFSDLKYNGTGAALKAAQAFYATASTADNETPPPPASESTRPRRPQKLRQAPAPAAPPATTARPPDRQASPAQPARPPERQVPVPPAPPAPPARAPERPREVPASANHQASTKPRVTPVEITSATRRGERYHLTQGNGYTLCGQPCSTDPAPHDLTFLPHRDCQRCVLELRRRNISCPVCDEPLFQVTHDGRCLSCARKNATRTTTSIGT